MGWLLLLCGIAGIVWANKLAFEKRNEHGVEMYESFWHMLRFRSAVSAIGLLSFFAIMAGLIIVF